MLKKIDYAKEKESRDQELSRESEHKRRAALRRMHGAMHYLQSHVYISRLIVELQVNLEYIDVVVDVYHI